MSCRECHANIEQGQSHKAGCSHGMANPLGCHFCHGHDGQHSTWCVHHTSESSILAVTLSKIGKLEADLKEAEALLQVAWMAHQKLGLEGDGASGHPHEIRMFALHFSSEADKDHVTGDGRYWRFMIERRRNER